jgi:hypothetical protein
MHSRLHSKAKYKTKFAVRRLVGDNTKGMISKYLLFRNIIEQIVKFLISKRFPIRFVVDGKKVNDLVSYYNIGNYSRTSALAFSLRSDWYANFVTPFANRCTPKQDFL